MYVNRTFLPTVCFNYIIVNNSQDVQNIYVHVAYVFISLPQIILMMYTVQYIVQMYEYTLTYIFSLHYCFFSAVHYFLVSILGFCNLQKKVFICCKLIFVGEREETWYQRGQIHWSAAHNPQ